MRVAGSLLILLGTTGIGYLAGLDFQRQWEELACLRRIFLMLKGEIHYMREPLEEAFAHIAERTKEPYSQFLRQVSERLRQRSDTSFGNIWNQAVSDCLASSRLKKENVEQLRTLGDSLGYLDQKSQEGAVDLYLELLETEMKELRREIRMKRKLCNSLGVMGGLFITVLLL